MNIKVNGGAAAATGVLFLGEPVIKVCRKANAKHVRYFEDKFDTAREKYNLLLATKADNGWTGPEPDVSQAEVDEARDQMNRWGMWSHRSDVAYDWIDVALQGAGVGFGAAALVAVLSDKLALYPGVLLATGAGALIFLVARIGHAVGVKAYTVISDRRDRKAPSEEQLLEEQLLEAVGHTGGRKSKTVKTVLRTLRTVISRIASTLRFASRWTGYAARYNVANELVAPVLNGTRGGSFTTGMITSLGALIGTPFIALTAVLAAMDYMKRAGIVVPTAYLQYALLAAGTATVAIIGYYVVKIVKSVRAHRAESAAKASEERIAEAREVLTMREEIAKTLDLVEQKERASANLLKQITLEYKEASDANDEAKATLAKAKEDAAKMRARTKTGPTPKRPTVAAVPTPATLPKPAPKADAAYDEVLKAAAGLTVEEFATATAAAEPVKRRPGRPKKVVESVSAS